MYRRVFIFELSGPTLAVPAAAAGSPPDLQKVVRARRAGASGGATAAGAGALVRHPLHRHEPGPDRPVRFLQLPHRRLPADPVQPAPARAEDHVRAPVRVRQARRHAQHAAAPSAAGGRRFPGLRRRQHRRRLRAPGRARQGPHGARVPRAVRRTPTRPAANARSTNTASPCSRCGAMRRAFCSASSCGTSGC